MEPCIDRTAASALFAWLDREIWLLTSHSDSHRGGLIATFVCQASLVPDLPRVLVGISRQHHTWQLIESSKTFAVHLLGQENLDWVPRFGLQSGRHLDKFAGLPVHTKSTGSPILESTVGWMDCEVESRMETGDRTLYLGRVVESQVTRFGPPLTTKQVIARLSPEELQEMKRLWHHDVAIDAEAIERWRQPFAQSASEVRA